MCTTLARCEPLAALQSVFLNAQCKGASLPVRSAGLCSFRMRRRGPPDTRCALVRVHLQATCVPDAAMWEAMWEAASPSTVFGTSSGLRGSHPPAERARWWMLNDVMTR